MQKTERDDGYIRELERLRFILMNVGEGVAAADVENRVIFLNPRAEEMLGVKFGEVMGRPIWNCHAEPEYVEKALRQAETGHIAVQSRVKEGFCDMLAPDMRRLYGFVLRER